MKVRCHGPGPLVDSEEDGVSSSRTVSLRKVTLTLFAHYDVGFTSHQPPQVLAAVRAVLDSPIRRHCILL